jgi:hypothetical protein
MVMQEATGTMPAAVAGRVGQVEEGLCLLAEALAALEASGRGDLLEA